jgi:indole-3-glycerol phosphate synthase
MILDEILDNKRTEVAERKRATPSKALEALARSASAPRDFLAALAGGRQSIRLIAEYKRASPSKGAIRADLGPTQAGRLYESAGAAAISVLTDEKFFSGRLDDLRVVREGAAIPVLRKEFIIDPWQLLETRAAGADAVLLIVAALDDTQLRDFREQAFDSGMHCLVEVHDEKELERALDSGAAIVGINNRDLRSFRVDLGTTFRLRAAIPQDKVVVSESGIAGRADVLRLQEAGVDAMLVGETLMRRQNPADAVKELLGRTISDY